MIRSWLLHCWIDPSLPGGGHQLSILEWYSRSWSFLEWSWCLIINIVWVYIPLPCWCLGVINQPRVLSLFCWSSCTWLLTPFVFDHTWTSSEFLGNVNCLNCDFNMVLQLVLQWGNHGCGGCLLMGISKLGCGSNSLGAVCVRLLARIFSNRFCSVSI